MKGLAHAVAEVAKIVFARNGAMQTGQLPVAPSLIAVVQIAAKLSIIGVLIVRDHRVNSFKINALIFDILPYEFVSH